MHNHVAFQITLQNGTRLWPAFIFSKTSFLGEKSLKDIYLVQEMIEKDGALYVQSAGYDLDGNDASKIGILDKEEIAYIQGPIEVYKSDSIPLHQVFSLSEAAAIWDMPSATIRKAIERTKLSENEVRKSESIHLITYAAMQRLFGAVPITKFNEVPLIAVTSLFLDVAKLSDDGNISIHKVSAPRKRKRMGYYSLFPAYYEFPENVIIDKRRFFDHLRCVNLNANHDGYRATEDEHNIHLAEIFATVIEAYHSQKKVHMLNQPDYESITKEEDIMNAVESTYSGWGEMDRSRLCKMLQSDVSHMLGMPKIINYNETVAAISK